MRRKGEREVKAGKGITGILTAAAVLSVLALSMTGCGRDKTPKARTELKIGVVCPLSGTAGDGVYLQKAAELATSEINAAGGINGMQVKLYVEDDEGAPAKSVTVTRKLVSHIGVDVLVGAQQSSCTLADMIITEEEQVPQITPGSSAPAITQQGNEWIFRTSISDATAAKTILKEISQEMGGKKIAVVHDSTDFGVNAAKMIEGLVGEYGLEIVAEEQFNADDADFTSILTKVNSTKPDAIVCWGYYAAASQICKQMKQNEVEIPFLGYGFNNPSFTELGAQWVEGAVVASGFTELTAEFNDKVAPFGTAFRQYFNNEPPTQVAAQTYDTIYLIKEAVERLGHTDFTSEELRDELKKTSYTGVTGNQSFDENGDIVKDCTLVTYNADGEQVLYNPKDE